MGEAIFNSFPSMQRHMSNVKLRQSWGPTSPRCPPPPPSAARGYNQFCQIGTVLARLTNRVSKKIHFFKRHTESGLIWFSGSSKSACHQIIVSRPSGSHAHWAQICCSLRIWAQWGWGLEYEVPIFLFYQNEQLFVCLKTVF